MTYAHEIANATFIIGTATGRIGCYINGDRFDIEITSPKSGTFTGQPIWDQVHINGINCGNRCGGWRTLLIMIGEKAADYDFADREAIAYCEEYGN